MSKTIEAMRRSIKQRQMHKLALMEPGRALDVLVARFVEGLQIECRSIPEMGQDYWIKPLSSVRSEDGELERVPTYSTTIYSAHNLLNRYEQWQLQGDTGAGIRAELHGSSGSIGSSGLCRTIPEAISKAAIALKIADNHLIEDLLEDHEEATEPI